MYIIKPCISYNPVYHIYSIWYFQNSIQDCHADTVRFVSSLSDHKFFLFVLKKNVSKKHARVAFLIKCRIFFHFWTRVVRAAVALYPCCHVRFAFYLFHRGLSTVYFNQLEKIKKHGLLGKWINYFKPNEQYKEMFSILFQINKKTETRPSTLRQLCDYYTFPLSLTGLTRYYRYGTIIYEDLYEWCVSPVTVDHTSGM